MKFKLQAPSMELYNTFITLRTFPPLTFRRLYTCRSIKSTVYLSSTAPNSGHRIRLAKSLQDDTLKTLEWPSVCNQVSAFTSTTMGVAAARNARVPLGRSPDESKKLLAQTTAAVALPRPLDFSGIEDVSEIVDSAIAGELLSISELCTVKRTLASARGLFEQLDDMSVQCNSSERYYPLLEILQDCNFLKDLEQKIGFCIDCKLSMILDKASDDLELLRSERKRNMEKLESLLKQISVRVFQAGGIDRPLVTKRRSRMCVGVKASHKSLVHGGITLNVSSSGATYFVEPKEAVEFNNMEVRLLNAVKVEEQAILSFLTSSIVESEIEIKYLLDRVLEVDFAFARALHAQWMNGVCPVLDVDHKSNVTDSLLIDIEGIQHPLLLETSLRSFSHVVASKSGISDSLNEGNGTRNCEMLSGPSDFPVPIDIKIECGKRVVVISGPNTGGKTASMKTLGLASVMLKAGMYLPARNQPRLPWFDLILADVGDHQSLEQNLSTFSGHISRICKILEVASEESLILLDEIGSGTDPSEGVALSASILQYLKDRVNLALVTTHYADLSRLKEKDSRFENAAMEFSLETLQPTYRVLWGSTGESNALSIAESIGFNDKIIERAKTWVEKLLPEKLQKQKGLLYQSLVEERSKLENQANRAASLHSDVMKIYNEIREEAEDLEGRVEALKAKETEQIQREIKAAKSQIENVVQEFEKKIKTASADQFNLLLKKSESAIASIVETHRPTDVLSVSAANGVPYKPRLGEQILVKGLGNKLATVVEEPGEDDTVLVQYGKIRVRVNISSIKALPVNDANTAKRSVPSMKKQVQRRRSLKNLVDSDTKNEVPYEAVVQTSKNTIDLRGMRVEEASLQLKMAIGSSGSKSVLFIIHGIGTGVLKESAHEILRKHPCVAKFEQENPMNYGCTVAYIK